MVALRSGDPEEGSDGRIARVSCRPEGGHREREIGDGMESLGVGAVAGRIAFTDIIG